MFENLTWFSSSGAIVIVEWPIEFTAALAHKLTVQVGSSAENGQKISGQPLLDLIAWSAKLLGESVCATMVAQYDVKCRRSMPAYDPPLIR